MNPNASPNAVRQHLADLGWLKFLRIDVSRGANGGIQLTGTGIDREFKTTRGAKFWLTQENNRRCYANAVAIATRNFG